MGDSSKGRVYKAVVKRRGRRKLEGSGRGARGGRGRSWRGRPDGTCREEKSAGFVWRRVKASRQRPGSVPTLRRPQTDTPLSGIARLRCRPDHGGLEGTLGGGKAAPGCIHCISRRGDVTRSEESTDRVKQRSIWSMAVHGHRQAFECLPETAETPRSPTQTPLGGPTTSSDES